MSFPVGAWKTWDEHGQLLGTQTFDAHGQPSGEFCDYDVHGKLIECQPLKEGTGTLTRYDGNGEKQAKLRFRGGKLHGVAEYFADGRRVSRLTYKNGELDGVHEEWDKLL